MKLLTIHRATPPIGTDFCHAIEGELAVTFGAVCDNPDCGCDRAFTGLNSAKASTTVMVRALDIDTEGAVQAAIGFLHHSGCAQGLDQACILTMASELINDAVAVAAHYPPGTVLRTIYDRADQCWDYTVHTVR